MQRSKNKSKNSNNFFFPEESDSITSVSGRTGNYQILTSKALFWINGQLSLNWQEVTEIMADTNFTTGWRPLYPWHLHLLVVASISEKIQFNMSYWSKCVHVKIAHYTFSTYVIKLTKIPFVKNLLFWGTIVWNTIHFASEIIQSRTKPLTYMWMSIHGVVSSELLTFTHLVQ